MKEDSGEEVSGKGFQGRGFWEEGSWRRSRGEGVKDTSRHSGAHGQFFITPASTPNIFYELFASI